MNSASCQKTHVVRMAAQKPSVKIKNDTCPMAVVNRHVKQQILFSFESPHDRISAKPSCSHRKYRFCLVSLTIQNLHVSKSKHAVPNPPVCQCSPMRTDIRAGSIYPVAPLSCREAARRVAHGVQLDARRPYPTTGRSLMAPLYLATALEPSSWIFCSLEMSWDRPSWEKTADIFCLPLKANLILVAGR